MRSAEFGYLVVCSILAADNTPRPSLLSCKFQVGSEVQVRARLGHALELEVNLLLKVRGLGSAESARSSASLNS